MIPIHSTHYPNPYSDATVDVFTLTQLFEFGSPLTKLKELAQQCQRLATMMETYGYSGEHFWNAANAILAGVISAEVIYDRAHLEAQVMWVITETQAYDR